jgi:transposase-like protein
VAESVSLRVSEVARRLGVTSQAVRDWIRSGQIVARKSDRIWIVDGNSVECFAATRRDLKLAPARVEDRLRELTEAVAQLSAREAASAQLLRAVERERDRFRAEAAASKEAALRVNSAAREVDQAVRHLLEVLELQADALTQLLAPSSPEDLLS